jgi:signal transduction histidine kinase
MPLNFLFKSALRRFSRRGVNRRAVQELGRSLALIVDREALEASVAARIRELFDPDRLILLEASPAGGFVPSFSIGVPAEEMADVELSLRGKLARWLTVNETSLVLDRQPGVYDYLDPAERGLLDRLRLHVCVPMISLNRLTGILLLGAERPGWGLTRGEIELLDLLARQASLAFENAALYRAQRERLDRLYRAERLAAVGQLAAGVAHEIRNPLTAIRSTMQYLLRGFAETEPQHQLVAELLNEVDRINSTVGGLLSLSRSGEIRLVPIDLLDPLRRALKLFKAHAEERGVELRTSLDSAPVRVLGDAGQLEQVFLNLLLNALQSMSGEGGDRSERSDRSERIEMAMTPWHPPSGAGAPWVQVLLADTGPGISPEQLRRVFDPFYTTKKDGTGLGLAICHGIIEQHQGEIQLQSELGKGTTASVRLPLIESH